MPSKEQLYVAAAMFHKNFSAGKFDDNGPLVAEHITVDSNTVKFEGRENFVARIKRFDGPFPGLQLRDRLILIEGNKAAVHFHLQGEHNGPFGEIAPTGRKVDIKSGEIFLFDDQVQMADLVTVTELDRLSAQITGRETVEAHEDVRFLENGEATAEQVEKHRDVTRQIYDNFSAGDYDASAELVAEDITLMVDAPVPIKGRQAFLEYSKRHRTAFPDISSHIEEILVDGRRACVSYHQRGAHHGDFHIGDGTVIPATGKVFSFRAIEFLHFNDQGLVDELIVVSNIGELVGQLRG